MTGRALLIGVALDGLSGVENDVAAIEAALARRGITGERCVGPDATRAGILAAYERLIAAVGPDEAAVVYYSGHGGRVTAPDPGTSGPEPLDLQFIVPYDFRAAGPGDHNVITSVELSVLQARLTQKTKNVVVILDCCHSAGMSKKDPWRRPLSKALEAAEPYDELWAHVRRLQAAGELPTDLLKGSGNPDAVRIVACAPTEQAWEYDGDNGRIGVLTESLVLALTEAGDEPVTWSAVLGRVRGRVMDLFASQRPEAEGPSRRLLFATDEADVLTSLPLLDIGGGRVALACAPLLGVVPGDTFMVMPGGATGPDAATRIGDLRVDRVGPLEAQGPVAFAGTWTKVPVDARAHRVGVGAQQVAVSLPESGSASMPGSEPGSGPGSGPAAEALARAVDAAPLLRRAGAGEAWQAAVRLDEQGGLTVEDRVGALHTVPRPGDDSGVRRVLTDLNALARATVLRGLTGDPRWALDAGVSVEWGLVRDGERVPQPDRGAVVPSGSLVYVVVHNGGDEAVYVSLVDIGVTGRVTVLTRTWPSGVKLAKGRDYLCDRDSYTGELVGVELTWPEGVERRGRPEQLLVLVTSEPHDVTILEQGGVEAPKGDRELSPFQAVLDQIATGRFRDLAAGQRAVASYDLHVVEFEHDPAGVGRD